MARLLALVLLAGCGGVGATGAVCDDSEVACGDARCVLICRGGQWETLACKPCGESFTAAGWNRTTCTIAPECRQNN